MAPESKLNQDQHRQVAEWLGDGYTNVAIARRIDDERRRDIRYDGVSWPQITRQTIAYWRSRHDLDYREQAARGFSVAHATVLARREVYHKRLILQIDRAEAILNQLMTEAETFLDEGVAHGVSYPTLRDEPSVIDVTGSIDGRAVSRGPLGVPAALAVSLGDDPRWCRLEALLGLIPKHGLYIAKLYELLARTSGQMMDQKRPETATPQEKLKSAETIVDRLKALLTERATVPA